MTGDNIHPPESWRKSAISLQIMLARGRHVERTVAAGALVTSTDSGLTWTDRRPGGPYDTHTLDAERADGITLPGGFHPVPCAASIRTRSRRSPSVSPVNPIMTIMRFQLPLTITMCTYPVATSTGMMCARERRMS